jgi:cytochrome b subunit of formate dehydrogenase
MQLTSAGIGIVLLIITGVLIWKEHGEKARAWTALIGGAFASTAILGWLGGVAAMTVGGAAVVTVAAVVAPLVFWLEVVRKKKPHKWRTPIVGLVAGAALVATFGGVQHAVDHSTVQVTTFLHKTTGRG